MFRKVLLVSFKCFILLLFILNDCDSQTTTLPSTTVTEESGERTTTITTEGARETTSSTSTTTTTEAPPEQTPPDTLEIIEISVIPSLGNAVKLVWGQRIPNYEYNLNWTYGVYYGQSIEELDEPRMSTDDLFVVVKDLEFCKKYLFGIGVIESYGRIDTGSSFIRSVVTFADRSALPKNVTIDFEPGEVPGIGIRWTASCPYLAQPIGYIITVLEKPLNRITFITVPETRQVDLAHSVAVKYGTTYDVKIATTASGFNTTDIVTFQTPYFLQPYKVRITTNPDGTFMMFWREPFVPYFVGEYFYEVFVYRGRNVSDEYESYKVHKPVYIHEGEDFIYTFSVGLTSASGKYKSFLTQPIVADKNGETYTVEIYNKKAS